MTIILGIDPGIGRMGYAVIASQSGKTKILDCGCITTPANTPEPRRLLEIKTDLDSLVGKWKPQVMAIETLYFAANSKTAMTVGQARGVAVLTGAQHSLQIIEMTPLQVKMSITGYGKAEKTQVQKMLLALFGLKKVPRPDDAADALAIAWAAMSRIKLHSKI